MVRPGEPAAQLGPRMRVLLLACAAMNASGAVAFAPPFPHARELLGLPAAPPLYLWIISSWIGLFGLCYLWLGLTGGADRTFLAVAAGGKAVFGGLLVALAAAGDLPTLALAGGLPDVALACVFVGWLIHFRPR